MWQNLKTKIVKKKLKTKKLTKLENSKCDKTPKLKMWQNSTQNNDKTKKNSNCEQTKLKFVNTKKLKIWHLKNPKGVKTLELKMWQSSKNLNKKNLNWTRLKNSKCDKLKK